MWTGRPCPRGAGQAAEVEPGATICTVFNEADMSEVIRLRGLVQEDFMAKHGVKLGILSFFVKAAVQGLRDVPVLGFRHDGDGVGVERESYDIGVAVESGRGVVAPVIRDAGSKSFAAIELEILAGVVAARDRRIEVDGLCGGAFTISNDTGVGSLMGTPVLHPPQSGTLGMHAIQDRPVARDGKVVIRPMMYLALSYDHRIVETGKAVRFLVNIKEAIENPTRLMLEI